MNHNQSAVITGLYTAAASIILIALGLLVVDGSNRPEVCSGIYSSHCEQGPMDKRGLVPLALGGIILLSTITAQAQLPKRDMSPTP
ncbi:hypothetical protein FEZ60_30870 [Rhodococcus sp. MS16]|uniref:hypothetical protein n=1 Tax=Rhodococcus sp. MS16 TaxID=2579941 RepID=UPI001561EE3A|nr:hypothetical protein [Rhodococcus sp. MS16]NRI69913.1 hypothetical protein [Rhodococcus sp. MS16]